MTKSLQVLLLEDSVEDAELLQGLLDQDGLKARIRRVETEDSFQQALDEEPFDIILSDYLVPGYGGKAALELARRKQPETPFIFVSGTIGEELAVESLKNGATDYVLKHHLERLPRSIRRALQEVEERRERHRAERLLREKERQLSAAQQMARLGSWSWDIPSDTLTWSDELHRILGLVPEEANKRLDTYMQHVHPEDRARVTAVIEKARGDCRPFTLQHRILRRDGSASILYCRGEVVADESGKAVRMIGIAQDVTDRHAAEEKIREQAALLDQARDAILVRNLDDCIVYWNKGAERIYGWTGAEALGKSTLNLLYKDPTPAKDADAQVMEQGEWTGELRHITKDGAEVTVQSRWTLVRDRAGKPKLVLLINTDITEKKKFEEQFLRTQRVESIGALAGGIAHDLNNILTPILMSIHVLRQRQTDPVSRKILETLATSAQHGSSLVKQVLSFARGVEGEKTVLQPRHILSDVCKMAKDTFPRGIQIQMVVAPDLWTIEGDATQLHQVLMNLCVNARDAMPQGGRLKLDAENTLLDDNYARIQQDARPGPHVVITVTDSGAGIPPELVGRIFEPFFTTKEVGKGTGLGLSTVAAIIKNHGGFLRVYSEVNRGTQFKLYFPAVRSQETARAEEDQPPPPQGRGECILVVDDEFLICDITQVTLEQHGYCVLTAHDGTEALTQFVRNPGKIDMVLTDLMMPFMDGPATIRALRKLDPTVKVIAMSGLMESNKVADAEALGVRSFLEKPFTSEKLATAVHRVLSAPAPSPE